MFTQPFTKLVMTPFECNHLQPLNLLHLVHIFFKQDLASLTGSHYKSHRHAQVNFGRHDLQAWFASSRCKQIIQGELRQQPIILRLMGRVREYIHQLSMHAMVKACYGNHHCGQVDIHQLSMPASVKLVNMVSPFSASRTTPGSYSCSTR